MTESFFFWNQVIQKPLKTTFLSLSNNLIDNWLELFSFQVSPPQRHIYSLGVGSELAAPYIRLTMWFKELLYFLINLWGNKGMPPPCGQWGNWGTEPLIN